MEENKSRIKSNFLWNTIGSLFFLVCQWLITVLVVRLSDDYTAAGTLSLAMSITNIFAIIALFNVRNYQVSDTENRFSQSEYLAFRTVTVSLAFLLCLITSFVLGYNAYTVACIIAYMVLKLTENYADVFHGIAQRKWRLDIAGKSLLFRGFLMILSFVIVFSLTKDLLSSIIIMALTNLLSLLVYDLNAVRRIERLSLRSADAWRRMRELFRICLPMVIYGIAINCMMPVSKCILEAVHGTEMLGYYSSVTTVSLLIQTFVMLVFTPLIGVFGEAFSKGDRVAIARTLLKLIIMIGAITAVGLGLSAFFGEFVMTLVFGDGITPYVYLLYPTVIISALTALVWLLGMVLVVMRSMKCLLAGSIAGFVLSLTLSLILVRSTLFSGINTALMLGFGLVGAIYLLRFIYYTIRGK